MVLQNYQKLIEITSNMIILLHLVVVSNVRVKSIRTHSAPPPAYFRVKKLFQLIVLTHNTDMAFLSIHEGKLQLEKKIKNGEKHTIFFSLRK